MLLSWCEAWGASFLIIAFVAAANPFYPLFADVGVDPRFGVFSTPMLFRDEANAAATIHDPAARHGAGATKWSKS